MLVIGSSLLERLFLLKQVYIHYSQFRHDQRPDSSLCISNFDQFRHGKSNLSFDCLQVCSDVQPAANRLFALNLSP